MPPSPALTSRNGEDHLIRAALGPFGRGTYVDVGAFDGVHLSNTWGLEQLGWTGICVEPAPHIFPLLSRNRPGSLCLQSAVGAKANAATLSMDPTMLLSSLEPIEVVRTAFEAEADFRGVEFAEFTQAAVNVLTLNGILRRADWPATFDLLNLDVGAGSNTVIQGLDLDTHSPRLIVVTISDETEGSSITGLLEESGYDLCRTVDNSHFFSRETRVARLIAKTALTCFIPRNVHPFGLSHTRLAQRSDRVLIHGRGIVLHELANVDGGQAADVASGSGVAEPV